LVKPKSFRPWNPEQILLFQLSPVEWLPVNHLVFFLLCVGFAAVMGMAQVQVLDDVLQSGIRWRVTLHACLDQGSLVRFEKSGKGGRLLHQESGPESSCWSHLPVAPRAGSGWDCAQILVERIEAILRGSPLLAGRSERELVRGRLVRFR